VVRQDFLEFCPLAWIIMLPGHSRGKRRGRSLRGRPHAKRQPPPCKKRTRDMVATIVAYQSRHSEDVKKEVEAMEDRVKLKRGKTSSDEVKASIRWLILNIGFSKSKESKHAKITDLHWQIKELIACGFTSKPRGGCQEDTILQRLDQLDSKYNALDFRYDALINAI
jgi:hypothetical protein